MYSSYYVIIFVYWFYVVEREDRYSVLWLSLEPLILFTGYFCNIYQEKILYKWEKLWQNKRNRFLFLTISLTIPRLNRSNNPFQVSIISSSWIIQHIIAKIVDDITNSAINITGQKNQTDQDKYGEQKIKALYFSVCV